MQLLMCCNPMMMASTYSSVLLILSYIALCCGTAPSSATATGCNVYSLYDGGESAPWPWPVVTQAVISLLPEFPGEPLRSLHITLNSHRQDHVIYFDQYGNVICRDGGRRESSFHQIPANASTQLVYQWYHAIVEWQGGTLSINGHDVCSGMHLSHDIYNITLKYSEANGFAVFGCYPGCPLWGHSQLKLYNKPLPTESALASRNNLQHPISISLIVNRCYSKYQANCNKTITLNHGIRNHWVKIGWRNIVEVRVGDMTQSVDGVDDNGAGENGMQVILEDSSNVLWTFLSPTCTTEMVQMEDAPVHERQAEIHYPECNSNQLLFYISIGLGTALVGVICILFAFCIIINKRWKSDTSYSRVDHLCNMNMSIITLDDYKLQK